MYLNKITDYKDLQRLRYTEKLRLCNEIRHMIIEVVTKMEDT